MDWFLYDNGLRHERLNKGTIHGYTTIETVSAFKYKLRLTQDDDTMYSFPQRHFTNKGHQQIWSEG